MERIPQRTPTAQFDILDFLLPALEQIPIIGDIIEIFTGIIGGDLGDLTDWVGELLDVDGVNDIIGIAFGVLADLLDFVPIIGGTLSDILDNIAAGLNTTHSTATTAAGTATTAATSATTANNRIDALLSGEVVTTISASGAWNKPVAPATGWKKHTIYGLGSGGGARRGSAGTGSALSGGGPGGQGGYAIIPLADSVLPSTVTVTIGAPGVGATSDGVDGGAGNDTVFGPGQSYEVRAGGGPGGQLGTTGDPNSGSGTEPQWNAFGGYGRGAPDNVHPSATNGRNGYLCTGGAASQTGAGSNGSSPPAGKIGPGSGGGGGGRATTTSATGQKGGDGGAPAGGGAGGGTFSLGGTAGNGGNGGIGKMWVVSSPI